MREKANNRFDFAFITIIHDTFSEIYMLIDFSSMNYVCYIRSLTGYLMFIFVKKN